MKKYKLEITVFLCGLLGMVLELVAARILSPYVGSSHLIWTTIIGVMLTSMSLGYWVGGKLADKNTDINKLSSYLLLGALSTSLIPIMETVLVKQFVVLTDNLVAVACITSAIIFGVPSFVLSIASPYAVKLKNEEQEQDNVGKVSGKISSLSTIGSIVGTFIAGFLLIPMFGIRSIILGITVVLVLLSVLLSKNRTKEYFALIIIIMISIFGIQILGNVIFKQENSNIIEEVDSEYSRIFVKEVGNYKLLQVDDGLESYIDTETGNMGAQYLYYYDLADYFTKNYNKTLIIGGAAYTYPIHYLDKYSDKTIDVVEIDPKMTELAQKHFGLNVETDGLGIYHQDGRSFLNSTTNKYDVILIDAFKGLNAPFELTTYEALLKARNILGDNGLVITNIISAIDGKDSDFIKYEYTTYKEVFDDVKLFKVSDADENKSQNLILIGIKGNLEMDENKYVEYSDLLKNELLDFKSNKRIVTDNYAPIGN